MRLAYKEKSPWSAKLWCYGGKGEYKRNLTNPGNVAKEILAGISVTELCIIVYIGPMKGVIPTPDIAKIFHPTPDIEGKKCPTPDIQNVPRQLTPNFIKM